MRFLNEKFKMKRDIRDYVFAAQVEQVKNWKTGSCKQHINLLLADYVVHREENVFQILYAHPSRASSQLFRSYYVCVHVPFKKAQE